MWVVADLDEEYIAKMEDVLETYEQAYDPQEPVVCLDEKPVTLHADVRPASAAQPGREARRDNEYERCGTANVFCAVEPKAGRHFTFATPDRSGFEFAQVAVSLALAYPAAKTIHLVMDNRGNAWGSEESLTLRVSAGKRRPGIGGSIVIASRSPGCSIAELLARSSATKRNPLRGQRPRGIRRMSAASGP